ncbi:MAG: nitrous oxide reductase accessory protein NosL [Parvularculaceae bacterium]
MKKYLGLLLAGVLSGCGAREEAAPPPDPAPLTREAVGYYCGMTVVEHEGPKAQIFVQGQGGPIWFSQVRDGVVYTRSPEETMDAVAFYVTDMQGDAGGRNMSALKWIKAEDAYFVIESDFRGGMGAPETIPFSSMAGAVQFQAAHGGRVVTLSEIPDDYVLAPYEGDMSMPDGDADEER